MLARVCCSLGTGSSASTVRTSSSCHTSRPSICSSELDILKLSWDIYNVHVIPERVVHVSKCTCGAPSPVIETECCVTTLTASKCRVRWVKRREKCLIDLNKNMFFQGNSCSSLPLSQHNLHSTSQPSTYLHLPSPKDLSFSKPHESETFKVNWYDIFSFSPTFKDYNERGDGQCQGPDRNLSPEVNHYNFLSPFPYFSFPRFDKTGPISHQPRPESRLSDSSDECRADVSWYFIKMVIDEFCSAHF